MRSRRNLIIAGAAILLLAISLVVAQPRPAAADADIGGAAACDAADGGVGVLGGAVEDITGGAIGAGNPLGDLCEKVVGKVTGAITSPVASALKGVGDDVFKEMTRWVAQGAGWLMGQVVEAVDSSTTPHLNRTGFLSEYTKMSAIAVLLAVAALLAAILQGIAQGSPGLMLRVVLVNAPLAFIGTSIAFVVVQLLVGATDSLCHAITAGTGDHGSQLFEAAISDLGKVGGAIGEAPASNDVSAAQGHDAGQVVVPLFVGFLLAVVGALAALAVLVELLFRDAGIYAVSLFMPFALYSSISPQWGGVMRRYAEALFALIESKFIIVAVITLAGTLIAKENSSVEVVLVATALMAMSCFGPFLLFRFVSISGGAAASSLGRRSAAGAVVGGASRTAHTARTVTGMVSGGDRSGGKGGSGVRLWNATDLQQNAPKPPAPGGGGKGTGDKGSGGGTDGSGGAGPRSEGPKRPPAEQPPGSPTGGPGKSGAGAGSTAGAGAEAGAVGAVGTVGAVGALGAEAAKTPQKAADRLADTGVAKSAAGDAGAGSGGEEKGDRSGAGGTGAENGAGDAPGSPGPAERPPRPDTASGPAEGGGTEASSTTGDRSDRPPRPPSQRAEAPDGEDAGGTS